MPCTTARSWTLGVDLENAGRWPGFARVYEGLKRSGVTERVSLHAISSVSSRSSRVWPNGSGVPSGCSIQ